MFLLFLYRRSLNNKNGAVYCCVGLCTVTLLRALLSAPAKGQIHHNLRAVISKAQLFEGQLALNPGLNLTLVSLSCVQKHFLG